MTCISEKRGNEKPKRHGQAEANAVRIRCAVREVRPAQNEDQEVHEVEGNAVPPRCAGKEVRLPQNEEEPDVHEVVDVPLEAPYA